MIKIHFINHLNHTRLVEAEAGATLMQAAVDNGVPGIVAECGGFCSCATCVCFVDAAWADKLEPANEMEQAMLESVGEERAHGRLSCQVALTPEMDGLTVHLPESQY